MHLFALLFMVLPPLIKFKVIMSGSMKITHGKDFLLQILPEKEKTYVFH